MQSDRHMWLFVGHPIIAPGGTVILSFPVPKNLLMMPDIDDPYILARDCTATLDKFAKANIDAISKT